MKMDINSQIIDQGKNFGACLVGIANFEPLLNSPSHTLFGKLDRQKIVGLKNSGKAIPEDIGWPSFAKSIIVVAAEHPEDKSELDWWQEGFQGGTPGNRTLININSHLSEWLEKEKGFSTKKLPYHIEKGGIFLKDAAVMAGLGCVGKNNLFVTPKYGPRVRLRALILDVEFPTTGMTDFNPCKGCDMPCRTACPQSAFQKKIYHGRKFGLDKLPGRNGVYNRQLCNVQMEMDIINSEKTEVIDHTTPGKIIKYCRLCEFACPVGKV